MGHITNIEIRKDFLVDGQKCILLSKSEVERSFILDGCLAWHLNSGNPVIYLKYGAGKVDTINAKYFEYTKVVNPSYAEILNPEIGRHLYYFNPLDNWDYHLCLEYACLLAEKILRKTDDLLVIIDRFQDFFDTYEEPDLDDYYKEVMSSLMKSKATVLIGASFLYASEYPEHDLLVIKSILSDVDNIGLSEEEFKLCWGLSGSRQRTLLFKAIKASGSKFASEIMEEFSRSTLADGFGSLISLR